MLRYYRILYGLSNKKTCEESKMIEQAVLLCAGKGTRLGPITSHTPKPLVQVGGKPFVCWFIEDLVDVGVKDIILLTGYLSDRFNFLRELYCL